MPSLYLGGGILQRKGCLGSRLRSGSRFRISKEIAKSILAGDYSGDVLRIAKNIYSTRVPLIQFNANAIPLKNKSIDVVIIFEAIYYLPSVDIFISESKRILRDGGRV